MLLIITNLNIDNEINQMGRYKNGSFHCRNDINLIFYNKHNLAAFETTEKRVMWAIAYTICSNNVIQLY